MNERAEPYNGQIDEALLTAYALEQLEGPERALVEAALKTDHKAQTVVQEVRQVAGHLRQAAGHEHEYAPSASLREMIEERLEGTAQPARTDAAEPDGEGPAAAGARVGNASRRRWTIFAMVSAAVLLLAVAIPSMPGFRSGTPSNIAFSERGQGGSDTAAADSAATAEPLTAPAADTSGPPPVAEREEFDAEGSALDAMGVVPHVSDRGSAEMSDGLADEDSVGAPPTVAAKAISRAARGVAAKPAPAKSLSEMKSGAARHGAEAKAATPPALKGVVSGDGRQAEPAYSQSLQQPAPADSAISTYEAATPSEAPPSDPFQAMGESGRVGQRRQSVRGGQATQPFAPPAPMPTQKAPAPYPSTPPVAEPGATPPAGTYSAGKSAPQRPAADAEMGAEAVNLPSRPIVPPANGPGGAPVANGAPRQPTQAIAPPQSSLGVRSRSMQQQFEGQVQDSHAAGQMGGYGGRGYGGMGGMGGMGAYGSDSGSGYGGYEGYGEAEYGYGMGQPAVQQQGRLWADRGRQSAFGTEQYAPVIENSFQSPIAEPESTVSVDVDTASYANVRRFLQRNQTPPPGAVRVEEMVNYFRYDYPQPDDDKVPFSVDMETASCPWNDSHRLVRIGLKAKDIHAAERGPSNLVFLIDVSGSMRDANKLPLVKDALAMLVDQLTEDDRVSIVTYAGNAGLVLEPTVGTERQRILSSIEGLKAAGSTHGSAGLQMAYDQAMANFVPDGNNRVILCTDGDLNVGITDDDELVRLIQQKASGGVFLTVVGVGTGNLKDAKLEQIADKGNGSYAYVDGLEEARKVFVEQVSGSLVTVAKDVKIQIEFNPAKVENYRLIGYENRQLAPQDFNDDHKDAGEIGAGHSVTFLYEVVPTNLPVGQIAALNQSTSNLRYQRIMSNALTEVAESGELLALKLRYKLPDEQESSYLEFPVKDSGKRFAEASSDFRFAAAVAAFGLLLRGSQYNQGLTFSAVEEFAAGAAGDDPQGHRSEFLNLVRQARTLYGDSNPAAADAAQAMPAQTEETPVGPERVEEP